MKHNRKIIAFFLCISLLCPLLLTGLSVSAAEVYKGDITVETVTAQTGDEVVVAITINNNPGIMAMTFSITYDSAALTYVKFHPGYLLDYTVADHPDQNLVRFVNCESFNKFQNKAIVSLRFKVKDDATSGLHPISIQYSQGDFCNWKLDKIMPNITPGGVKVAFNGKNCPHKKYSAWTTKVEPGCNHTGVEQRVCTECGHIENRDIPQTAHVYEKEWIIDTPATATTPGSMSRHCMYCGNKIDILSFTLQQAEANGIVNEPGLSPTTQTLTDQLMQEQHPEGSKEPTASDQPDTSSKSSSGTPDGDSAPEDQNPASSSAPKLLSAFLTKFPGSSLLLLFAVLWIINLAALF